MTTLTAHVTDDTLELRLTDFTISLPVGSVLLTRRELTSDPPLPEELTNAIGLVHDHVDDIVRVHPQVLEVDHVEVAGGIVQVVADVEVGEPCPLPYELSRDAAEDVFRTLATEARRDRLHNPCLPAAEVDHIVGACCVIVGLMRRLRLGSVEIIDSGAATHPLT
jgi:exopolyphosphatase / guanosine-5'-triphosphate,3'-diphosphate pyrophosphatase